MDDKMPIQFTLYITIISFIGVFFTSKLLFQQTPMPNEKK
jgi:hypothetical protein